MCIHNLVIIIMHTLYKNNVKHFKLDTLSCYTFSFSHKILQVANIEIGERKVWYTLSILSWLLCMSNNIVDTYISDNVQELTTSPIEMAHKQQTNSQGFNVFRRYFWVVFISMLR